MAWLLQRVSRDWLRSRPPSTEVTESEVTLPIVSGRGLVCILRFFLAVAAAMAVASMRALLQPAACCCSSSRNGGREQELPSSLLGNASSSVFGDSLVSLSSGAVRWSQKASSSSLSSQPVSLLLSQWNSRGSVLLCVSIGLLLLRCCSRHWEFTLFFKYLFVRLFGPLAL